MGRGLLTRAWRAQPAERPSALPDLDEHGLQRGLKAQPRAGSAAEVEFYFADIPERFDHVGFDLADEFFLRDPHSLA